LISYEQAGVDVAKGDRFVERLKTLAKRAGHEKLLRGAGGYAAVYPVTADRCIALTTDGVGTKVLLAHQFGEHHGVGIDLVAMCANDLICVGAKPTLFLDYYATGKLNIEMGLALIEGIVDGCDQAGMILAGGETAEMPDVYEGSHYDLAGFAIGELARQELITGEAIQPGQKLIGVASSGIHSNGLSLARKILTDTADLQELLTPTRIYVKPVLEILKQFPGSITGMAHITGGGLRNLFRLNPNVGYEITDAMPILPIFKKMLSAGVPIEEAYKTFNMGMGLCLMVQSHGTEVISHLNHAGFSAKLVGEVTDQSANLTLPAHCITIKNA